jgi:hypothetical protein
MQEVSVMSTIKTHEPPDELHAGVHTAPGATQPPKTRAELDRENLLHAATDVVWIVMEMGQGTVVNAAQPTLWETACQLFESTNVDVRRFGYAMALSAIIATPNVLEQTARTLRQRLSDGIPVLWADQLREVRPEVIQTALAEAERLRQQDRTARAQPAHHWRNPRRYQWKHRRMGGGT